jgi:hypothetical protein
MFDACSKRQSRSLLLHPLANYVVLSTQLPPITVECVQALETRWIAPCPALPIKTAGQAPFPFRD